MDGYVDALTSEVVQNLAGVANAWYPPSAPESVEIDLRRAVRINRVYAVRLGWNARFDDIVRLLGFTDFTPDERLFARAVAQWQERNGLIADGIVGPITWAAMRGSLGALAPTPLPGPPVPAPPSGLLEIMSRSEWGARPARAVQTLRLPVGHIFVHHTAGRMPDASRQSEYRTMRGIQRYHQDSRGWADIAYNFVVMPSGRIGEGRGWRRVGAATRGWNSRSLSVCWAGNYQSDRPTRESLAAGRQLLAEAMRLGHLRPDFRLRGHRDASQTACPGRYLYPQLPILDPRN